AAPARRTRIWWLLTSRQPASCDTTSAEAPSALVVRRSRAGTTGCWRRDFDGSAAIRTVPHNEPRPGPTGAREEHHDRACLEPPGEALGPPRAGFDSRP